MLAIAATALVAVVAPPARAASYSDSVKAAGADSYWPLETWTSTGGCGSQCSSPDVQGLSDNAARSGTTTINESGAILTAPSTKSIRLNTGALFANTDELINANALSLELWFKTASGYTGPGDLFWDEAVHSGGNVKLQIDSAGRLVGLANYKSLYGSDTIVTGPVVTDGAWHHAAVVADQSGVRLLVDGTEAGFTPKTASSFVWAEENAWVPGQQVNARIGGNGFNGWVDEPVAYKRAITLTEERANYAASGRTPPPLVLAAPLTPWDALSPSSDAPVECVCDPVTLPFGTFWHSWPDFAIGGRGPGINFNHTYTALLAAQNGPFGYGFTYSYNMSISDPGTGYVTVREENGSESVFQLVSGSYVAADRVQATLVKNGDGTWAFKRRNTMTYSFNTSGQLTRITDLNGYYTDLAYTSGRLTTITDSASRALTLTWDTTNNRITQISDPSSPARTVGFAYNGNGEMSDYTDVAGGNWRFTYDASHRMLTMRDPTHTSDGKVVENHYDASGRVDWQKDELLQQTSIDYTSIPGAVITTDPKGNKVRRDYVDNVPVSVTMGYTSAAAATWTYEYDADEATVTEVTDPDNHVSSAVYDSSGNQTSTTDPLTYSSSATYNSFNQPLTVTDRNGVTTTYTYDSAGNLQTVSTPLVGSSPAVSRTVTYNYADTSHPGDVTSMVDERGRTWAYHYDASGNRDSATDPLGNKTTWAFNPLGWVTSMVSPRGNVVGGTPANFTTSYEYTSFGDVKKITDPLGNFVQKTFDGNRNVLTEQDPNHTVGSPRITTYVYDAVDQLLEIQRPDSSVLRNEYWADGTLKTQKDAANNATGYTYDGQARLSTVTDPLGYVTTYGYDGAGNQLTKQDPGGNCAATPKVGCTVSTYDAANRLATVTYSDGVTPNITSITYDNNGQRTALGDSASGSMAWSYDSLNRLTSSTVNSDVTSYGYADRSGLVTSISYPNSGGTIGRGYDDAGRWTSVTDWSSNTTTFEYDEDSNLKKTLFPGSVNQDDYAFNNAGQLSSTTFKAGGTTLGSLTYGRDNSGQVTSETSVSISGGTHSYEYNSLNQLTKRDTASTWTYDTADNLTKTGGGATQQFNAANQICYQTASGSGSCSSPPASATTYAFNPLGQRTNTASTTIGRTAYGYDQAQRLTVAAPSQPKLAMGSNFTIEIKPDGTVMSVGNNGSGRLGNGNTSNSTVPVLVSNITPGTVVSVAAGDDHALALKSDGTVIAWGNNSDGQLGNNSLTNSSVPVNVSSLTGVVAISAGTRFSLAVKNDGTVWTWGNNSSGELGRGAGNYTDSSAPVQVSGLTGVVNATAGSFHAVAARADGTVWTWGYGANGQLGNGVVANVTVATQVSGQSRVMAVAAGGLHTLALRSDGTVFSWGANANGQLGNGTTTSSGTPVTVSGLASVVAINAANVASTALKADGTAWGWGAGNNNGTSGSNVTAPAQISGTGAVTALGSGSTAYHTLLPSISGVIWAFGDNSSGQYGNNSTTTDPLPRRTLTTPTTVAEGTDFSVHIKSDGTVATSGRNQYGQLGNNTTTNSSSLVNVSGLTAGTITAVAAGDSHALALKSDGTVVAWGRNSDGQLGNNSTTDSSVPVNVSGLTGIIAISGGARWSLAVKRDGTVWTWGDNSGGQLARGNFTDSPVPVQIASFTDVVAAQAGSFHAIALKKDGTVYTWGWGADGQIGNGSTSTQTSPVQVTEVSNIVAVSCGGTHCLALRQDGIIYSWGGNAYGQLGNGTTTNSTSPVQVANLNGVVAISAHQVASQAIRSDGTGWGWGAGGGNGNSWTSATKPVPMTGLTSLATLATGSTGYHSLAVTTSGAVYAFGDNTYGTYGNATTSTSPTAVSTGTTDRVAVAVTSTPAYARYAYDANGQRRSKTSPRGTSTYRWDQSSMLESLLSEAGPDGTVRYLYGPGGMPVEQIDSSGAVRYFHHDQLGSTRLLTDSAGTSVGNLGYDEFGSPSTNVGATGTPLSYAGQYTDAETGLQYLRARYYEPATGQFLNRDPLESLTREPYGYAGNNPINRTDPTGMSWYDPRDWDQDVVNIAKDVGGRAVDVTVATVNAPVTAASAAVNSWTGGDCDWNPHLTVVCYDGAISGLSNRTFVTGSTINTTMSKVDFAADGGLLRHETWHTRQWAIFGGGPLFPLLYGLESLRTRGNECNNVFEIWAGLEDGGYEQCTC